MSLPTNLYCECGRIALYARNVQGKARAQSVCRECHEQEVRNSIREPGFIESRAERIIRKPIGSV